MKVQSSGLALAVGVLCSGPLFAGTVRTATVNNGEMAPINLRMGKSTVLRFVEKPKKVVVGNQNYYTLEFIENDVAIQPLGSVATNLFVYTPNHTYGFLLLPSDRYDDLVFVRWKYPQAESRAKDLAPSPRGVLPNLSFSLGNDLRVTVTKIQGPSTLGLHLIDCTVANLRKREIGVADLLLSIYRDGKSLINQSTVIERDRLKFGETTKARIVLKLESKAELILMGKLGKLNGKIKIGRKYL